MKLAFYFIVAALTTIAEGAVDVEKTVQQVQKILKTNALLPRLTRDEILQLLNDIRTEDAKSTLSLKEQKKEDGNKRSQVKVQFKTTTVVPNIKENKPLDVGKLESVTKNTLETTTKSWPKLALVLPYTPRDGSSLQELYTRPPRVEIVQEPQTTKTPENKLKVKEHAQKTSNSNIKLNELYKHEFPEELQAFLDTHGLKGITGQDNFLLPLDGFKPLPPAKVVDGSVQLPESILLAYDLISPSDNKPSSTNNKVISQNNFFYEPLPPKYPFELDTSSSEIKKTVLPFDLPKPRKTKAVTPPANYEPVDYDSVRVIPLNNGPSPIDDEKIIFNTELNKRQTNVTQNDSDPANTTGTSEEPTTVANEVKNAVPALDNDPGASISDLEESFGGAAPQEPGDSVLPPPRKNGFYWMLDWNSFLEVGDGDTKVNIRFEPKLGDPQMFLPVNVP